MSRGALRGAASEANIHALRSRDGRTARIAALRILIADMIVKGLQSAQHDSVAFDRAMLLLHEARRDIEALTSKSGALAAPKIRCRKTRRYSNGCGDASNAWRKTHPGATRRHALGTFSSWPLNKNRGNGEMEALRMAYKHKVKI